MIGFWHPFGDHGGETREQIIGRKKLEIKNNGWTLWSFQYRKDETIDQWLHQIGNKNRVFVFCSDSKCARDPIGDRFDAKQFSRGVSDKWIDIPKTIKIPHPFGNENYACAFVVKSIYGPEKIKIPEGIKWFCIQDKKWREDNLPTRGEYMIKSGGKCKLRKTYQILELTHPYLAVIKK